MLAAGELPEAHHAELLAERSSSDDFSDDDDSGSEGGGGSISYEDDDEEEEEEDDEDEDEQLEAELLRDLTREKLHTLDEHQLGAVRGQLEGFLERAREVVTDEGDVIGHSAMQRAPESRRVEALRERRAAVVDILKRRAASHRGAEATGDGQDALLAEILTKKDRSQ